MIRGCRRILDQTSEAGHPRMAPTTRSADPPHPRQRADDGRGDGPRRRGARSRRGRHRRPRRSGPHDRDLWAAAGPAAAHRQVPRLRLVESALAARAARPGRRGADRRALHRLAGPARRAARYLDDFWDSADVEVEGDPACQQAVRFGLFHVLQASARAERRAIAGKGLTGTGYDGHAFWDTEGFVLPVLTYTHPRRRRRRAALARVDARPGAAARRGTRPARVRAFPGARSAARSARRTGRRAPRPGTSTPTSPWPSSAIASSPATSRWRPTAGWRCSSRRRGCGIRSATTTATAYGTSTASPVPTSTPRSCATTSSPT